MKNLKLGFFSLFTAVLGHTCPSEVIPLDGGRWNCGGLTDFSRCYLTCDEDFYFEGNGSKDFVKCRCNKRNKCTWRPKKYKGECVFNGTTTTTIEFVKTTIPTTKILTTTTKILTTTTIITTHGTNKPEIGSCPILDYSGVRSAVVEHKSGNFIGHVTILPRTEVVVSDWSVVLFFDKPVENLKIDFYETKVASISGNQVILRSDGPESLGETKSIIYTVHDSDHVIGVISGFYPDFLSTYDCSNTETPTQQPTQSLKPTIPTTTRTAESTKTDETTKPADTTKMVVTTTTKPRSTTKPDLSRGCVLNYDHVRFSYDPATSTGTIKFTGQENLNRHIVMFFNEEFSTNQIHMRSIEVLSVTSKTLYFSSIDSEINFSMAGFTDTGIIVGWRTGPWDPEPCFDFDRPVPTKPTTTKIPETQPVTADPETEKCQLSFEDVSYSVNSNEKKATINFSGFSDRIVVIIFDEKPNSAEIILPQGLKKLEETEKYISFRTNREQIEIELKNFNNFGATIGWKTGLEWTPEPCFDFSRPVPTRPTTTVKPETQPVTEAPEKCVLNFEKTRYTVNPDVKTATVSFVDGQSFERSVVIFFNEESELSFSNDVTEIEKNSKLVHLKTSSNSFDITFKNAVDFGAVVGWKIGEWSSSPCYDNKGNDLTTPSPDIITEAPEEDRPKTTTKTRTTTTKTTTTTTTKKAPETPESGCNTLENIQNQSGSHKNSEWQDGGGFKFNRHIYIPIDGRTIENWKLILDFSAPITSIEAWVVDVEEISPTKFEFTPKNPGPLNTNQDPWIFNFLGTSTQKDSDLTVTFCM